MYELVERNSKFDDPQFCQERAVLLQILVHD